MFQPEMLLIISNSTIAEFKAMQKAMRILLNVGIDQFTALQILCEAMKKKKENLAERRSYNQEISHVRNK